MLSKKGLFPCEARRQIRVGIRCVQQRLSVAWYNAALLFTPKPRSQLRPNDVAMQPQARLLVFEETRIKTALKELEEAIDELQNAQQARAWGVDECVAAVLALNTEEVAEFQRKLMAAVWKNK